MESRLARKRIQSLAFSRIDSSCTGQLGCFEAHQSLFDRSLLNLWLNSDWIDNSWSGEFLWLNSSHCCSVVSNWVHLHCKCHVCLRFFLLQTVKFFLVQLVQKRLPCLWILWAFFLWILLLFWASSPIWLDQDNFSKLPSEWQSWRSQESIPASPRWTEYFAKQTRRWSLDYNLMNCTRWPELWTLAWRAESWPSSYTHHLPRIFDFQRARPWQADRGRARSFAQEPAACRSAVAWCTLIQSIWARWWLPEYTTFWFELSSLICHHSSIWDSDRGSCLIQPHQWLLCFKLDHPYLKVWQHLPQSIADRVPVLCFSAARSLECFSWTRRIEHQAKSRLREHLLSVWHPFWDRRMCSSSVTSL